MSATNRGGHRQPADFYETQPHVTRAILPHVLADIPHGSAIIDPCAGRGAILKEVRRYGLERDRRYALRGSEINLRRASAADEEGLAVVHADAFDLPTWGPEPPTLIITNPPFHAAMRFVQRALREVGGVGQVAMLMRLDWLASRERAPFHRRHPSDVYVLDRRPSFAASLRCKARCGWKVIQELDAPRADDCPDCGGAVSCSTSDASEYAWFCFGPARGNRWFILSAEGKASAA